MAIEILDDWNAILGQCCCEMPACPVPTLECESMLLELDICGIVGADHFGQSKPAGAGSTYYLTKTYTRVVDHAGDAIGPPPQHFERTQETVYFYDDEYPVGTAFSGSCDSDYSDVSSGSSFCPFAGSGSISYSVTGTAAAGYSIQRSETIGVVPGDATHSYSDVETHTYSNPITDQLAYLVGNAEARYAYLGFTANGSDCSSLMLVTATDADGDATALDWQRHRYRWVIPDTWLDQNTGETVPFPGTYFKITWDVATYPTDPAAEISYIQDLTWEWAGPGDPEDPESWKSGWYELDTPGEPGERKVVNVRFECYRSPQFGNKPQITGDAEDISDDVPLQYRFTSDNHSINLLRL